MFMGIFLQAGEQQARAIAGFVGASLLAMAKVHSVMM